MKPIILPLLVLLQTSLLAQQSKTTFYQDVATIHQTGSGLPEGNVSQIFLIKNTPMASTSQGNYEWNGSKWVKTKKKNNSKEKNLMGIPASAGNLLSTTVHNGTTYAGCEKALLRQDASGQWVHVLPADEQYSWSPTAVAALTVDSENKLWFGAREGVGYLDTQGWQLFTGQEGVPYNQFTCAAPGPNGEVWFGTTHGAIRAEGDYFYYRSNRRWLPHNHVNAITVSSDGSAWIATKDGISQITARQLTYEEKAAHFTRQVEERHNRMGFVCQSHLTKQFDITTSQLAISDNDGLYTAMYGAAHAFRYAVTGSEEARTLANRSFKACKWLVDITHEKGFPARVIIPIDWHEPVNEQYSREYNKRHQQSDPFWKDIFPRFPKSKDGNYRWKCDTSSDELAGHYFYYAIYYDLIAQTPEEKTAVKQVVADITDHLIRHDFKLIDHDGKPTRWANFSPDFFNSVWGWEQRGLNSMMMLSFLNVASHVTGDAKYEEVAQMLRDKHQYHINAMHAKEFFPPENAVPWDNNLSLMSLYGLMNYEKNPELLIMYRNALENAWLHISKQKNAFWDGLYGAIASNFSQKIKEGFFKTDELFTDNPLFADAALERYAKSNLDTQYMTETLQRIPLDLIGYAMDNTHRLDVVTDPTPGQKEGMGWRVDEYALPIDERGHVRLDRDAFVLHDSEGNGFAEHEGTFYLLPYYLGLYHELIKP